MADLQSKMDAHQQDIDRAKEQIDETTQKANSYLTEVCSSFWPGRLWVCDGALD